MIKKIIIALAVILLVPLIIYFAFPQVLLYASITSDRSKAGLEENSITIDEETIYYLEGGKGENIIMLHGLGGNKDNWAKFSKNITPQYHVISLDMPGSGNSTKITTALYTTKSQCERLEKIFKHLKINKFHLVGHSMGGAIAARYASIHPEQIMSLALIDTEGVKTPKLSDFDKLIAKGINKLSIKNKKDMKEALNFLFFSAPSVPGPVLSYLTKKSIENSEFNQKIFWDVFSEDYYIKDDLKNSEFKTLIMWGDTDRRIHISAVEILKKSINNSKSKIIKQCGHFPMREKPDESSKEYLNFIKKT